MSLIQEALKRKQDDAEQSKQHPSMEYKGSGGSQPVNLTMLGVILGVGFFFVVVLLLVLLLRSGPASVDTAAPSPEPTPPLEMSPTPSPVVRPAAQPLIPAQSILAVEPEVPPVPEHPPSAPPQIHAAAPMPDVQALIQQATPDPDPKPAPVPVVVTPPVRTPTPKPEPPPKPEWPTMRVMGVLTNPDADFDSAIVNGRIRDPGEVVDGVNILSVNNKGALLGYMGETQFVKVGRTYPE